MSGARGRIVWLLLCFALLAAIAFAAVFLHRPGLKAYAALNYHAAPQPGQLSATWLGVTALLLDDGQHAVLIDPFFSRPAGLLNMALDRPIAPDEKLIAHWLERLGIRQLDAVLVSHSHYDHAMDAGVVARLTGARLLGSASTANIGRGAGLDESHIGIVNPGEVITLGSFRVRFIESLHAGATGGRPTGDIAAPLVPPAHYLDYRLGGTYSIVVEHAQGSVLHHGSAGFVPGALDGLHADIAFLGVALIDDLESYLRNTVDVVGATRVIPTHWDDFSRPLDQPLQPFPLVVRLDRFLVDLPKLRPKLHLQTLAPGERVALFPAAFPAATSPAASPPAPATP